MNPLPRTVLNAWVALYGIDGLVQLAVVGVPALAAVSLMSRSLLLLGTLAIVILWVGFVRLPLWILAPLAVLAWVSGGVLPLPALWLDLTAVSLAAAGAQLLTALVMARGYLPGRFPLGDGALRAGPDVALGQSLLRVAVLIGCGVLGVGLQLAAMAWSLSLATDGYVSVDTVGLSTGHRACTREDTTVHLVGAVHIGESKGYDQLMAGIPAGSLLLAEGVSDADGLLGGRFGYDRLAKRLGLVPQRGPGEGPEAEGAGRFRVRRTDVDVNTFDPATLSLLRSVGEILDAKDPVAAYVKSITGGLEVTEDTLGVVVGDVLTKRNAHLLGVLDEVLPNEPVVIVPWGAMHLREVGRAVQARGFVCGPKRSIRMIEWATVRKALIEGPPPATPAEPTDDAPDLTVDPGAESPAGLEPTLPPTETATPPPAAAR